MAQVFLDTSVFLFATGADHPLRDAARSVLDRAYRGELQASTSAEVVQEILHVLARRGRVDDAIRLAKNTIDLFPDLLPVSRADVATACDLLARYHEVPVRDALHAATMLNHDIRSIWTADRHFQDIEEIETLDLADLR